MNTSLYELSQNYIQALDFLTDPENDIDTQTVMDTIEGLDDEIDKKLLNVARFIISIEHMAEGIEQVEKRQRERRKILENKADALREYIKSNMQAIGHSKVTDNDIAVSLAKTPAAVKIIDENLIPANFWREKIERVIDKTSIKNAGGCPGTSIETGFRVAIK